MENLERRKFLIAPLLIPAAAFTAGTALAVARTVSLTAGLAAMTAAIIFMLGMRKAAGSMSVVRNPWWMAVAVAVLFAGLGITCAALRLPKETHFPSDAQIIAKVTERTTRSTGDRLIANAFAIVKKGSAKTIAPIPVAVNTPATNALIGDTIIFPCSAETTGRPVTFTGEQYHAYLTSRGINHAFSTLDDELRNLSDEAGHKANVPWPVRSRDAIVTAIEKSQLRPDTQRFVITMLTGDRAYADDSLTEEFADAGIAHILALSGLHLAIIGIIFSSLLLPLNLFPGQKWRWLILIASLWVFTLVTGAAPSTVRACVMATLFYAGMMVERIHSPLNSLAAAVILILLFNPLAVTDAGLQMSVVCVAALIFFSDRVNPVNSIKHPLLYALAGGAATTLIATAASWTLTAWYFGRFPLLFLPVNMIAVPLLTPYMMAAASYTALLFTGNDIPLLAGICDTGFEWLHSLATAAASSAEIHPSAVAVILWLAGLAALAVAFSFTRGKWKRFIPAVAFLGASLICIWLNPADFPPDGLVLYKGQRMLNAEFREKGNITRYSYGRFDNVVQTRSGICFVVVAGNEASSVPAAIFRRLSEADIVVLGSSYKGGIRDLLAHGLNREAIVATAPSTRQKRAEELREEAKQQGLRFHSLSADGPLGITASCPKGGEK